jgi:methionine aminopeptidase
MGLIELVVTVCVLALPSHCEDQHFPFSANMSLNQCVMNAQPSIAQWINEHPKWLAVRWRCDSGGSKEKA